MVAAAAMVAPSRRLHPVRAGGGSINETTCCKQLRSLTYTGDAAHMAQDHGPGALVSEHRPAALQAREVVLRKQLHQACLRPARGTATTAQCSDGASSKYRAAHSPRAVLAQGAHRPMSRVGAKKTHLIAHAPRHTERCQTRDGPGRHQSRGRGEAAYFRRTPPFCSHGISCETWLRHHDTDAPAERLPPEVLLIGDMWSLLGRCMTQHQSYGGSPTHLFNKTLLQRVG